VSVELLRHVNALVADLAAEHGEIDLVGRRLDCDPDDRDALVETFESFGVVGGAGVRVRGDDGVLLVRYEDGDGWVDPGDARRPGESYRECANRALRDAAGVEADLTGLSQVHLLYMDDRTDRLAVPNPYLVFEGRRTDGPPAAGPGVAEVGWTESVPEEVVYEELAELSLSE
jgi:ADP-ribose pyrophosphatase YjhB (NUDIX family)